MMYRFKSGIWFLLTLLLHFYHFTLFSLLIILIEFLIDHIFIYGFFFQDYMIVLLIRLITLILDLYHTSQFTPFILSNDILNVDIILRLSGFAGRVFRSQSHSSCQQATRSWWRPWSSSLSSGWSTKAPSQRRPRSPWSFQPCSSSPRLCTRKSSAATSPGSSTSSACRRCKCFSSSTRSSTWTTFLGAREKSRRLWTRVTTRAPRHLQDGSRGWSILLDRRRWLLVSSAEATRVLILIKKRWTTRRHSQLPFLLTTSSSWQSAFRALKSNITPASDNLLISYIFVYRVLKCPSRPGYCLY